DTSRKRRPPGAARIGRCRRRATRLLLLFSREPRRQADEKGLRGRAGEQLFTAFARGWLDAARLAQARLVVSAPRADHAGWRRCLPAEEIAFLEQRGRSFGRRLEDAARQAAAVRRPEARG